MERASGNFKLSLTKLRSIFAAVLFTSTVGLVAHASEQEIVRRSVTTHGEAQVNVNPDLFCISAQIETKGRTLADVFDENKKTAEGILALRTKFNLGPNDVQVSDFRIGRGHSSIKRSAQVEYVVTRTVRFLLRDRKTLSKAIESMLDAGCTEIYEISPDTSTPRKYRDQARAMAVRAAKEKAELLAGELNAKIGRPIRIEEVTNQYIMRSSPYNSQNTMEQPAVETSDNPETLEQLNIRGSVKVEFELE